MHQKLLLILFLCKILVGLSQSDLPTDSIRKKLIERDILCESDNVGFFVHFNKDTMLLGGYLYDSCRYILKNNLILQSFDGGKSWNKKYFQGNGQIRGFHYTKNGMVWMGCTDNLIHFSTDFGSSWSIKANPFKKKDRVISLYMVDSLYGLAGSSHNQLVMTKDNWKTSKSIETHFDQNYRKPLFSQTYNTINKVQVLDSLILVKEQNQVFYSGLNRIQWKKFNIPVTDFQVNQQNKTIQLFSINKIYTLNSKLDLLHIVYVKRIQRYHPENLSVKLDLSSFFSAGIKSVEVKSVKYKYLKSIRTCMGRYRIYDDENYVIPLQDSTKLLSILSSYEQHTKPNLSFQFSEQDYLDYEQYYNLRIKGAKHQKHWYVAKADINHPYYQNPKETISNCTNTLLDSIYFYDISEEFLSQNKNHIDIQLINQQNDTLMVSNAYGLNSGFPWVYFFKRKRMDVYDEQINRFLLSFLPKEHQNSLFFGELIFRIIEEMIISEYKFEKPEEIMK